MSQIKEYDLKKSTELIGPLYPILEAKDGDVIDGVHRFRADHNWPRFKLDHIDSEEKKLAARLVANFHRRQVSRIEKEDLINALATLYVKEGFKVEGRRGKAQGANEVAERIVARTGLGRRTVMTYLRDEFKQNIHARNDPEQHATRAEAVDIIYNALKNKDRENPGYASRVIDRFKEELKKELLDSPIFRKEVLNMLPKSSFNQRPAPIPLIFNVDEEYAEERRKHAHYVRDRKKEGHRFEFPETIVLEPGWLLKDHLERFPECSCDSCEHKDSCDTRIYPDD